ncbi:hypothetical protein SCLCIDRAFT_17356 [Scleroderma citrinum Foug A]|uniref:DNA 3'-5' helicase n=1 Tax=Scleroderma citrinum Foug A TaxID=1036808 RepID=A0A0C2ZSX4_9AGAM|nr:hypothetical protein SCLCIDRAFT_17356 [Scleroderma citrinum Foug A]
MEDRRESSLTPSHTEVVVVVLFVGPPKSLDSSRPETEETSLTLNAEDKIDSLRACIIVHNITSGKIVPRPVQLQASLALLHESDVLITAGTGSGKTLCLLLPMLLRPRSMSITISSLKCLQATQVQECARYHIPTIAINEDTPSDPTLWESIWSGQYRHLIVSPEQLGMHNGHLPRLAKLIRNECSFTSKISRMHINEAHYVHTAGIAHYGEDAFRPAYSRLGQFCVFLPKETPFQALSATFPPHILSTVKKELSLRSNLVEIHLSMNRPNITYATHVVSTSLRDFSNLDFILPLQLHPQTTIPKTLVFHDSKEEATSAAVYINSRDMSVGYLQETFSDFSSSQGSCRVLHATAGASTGLDIQGVQVVIQYGMSCW